MRCRAPLPPGTEAVTVGFDHVWISFATAASKDPGSGLILSIGDRCRSTLLRVAGEDWIESSRRFWAVPVAPGARHIEIAVTLKDTSARDPVRIDLRGLRLEPGRRQDAAECSAAR